MLAFAKCLGYGENNKVILSKNFESIGLFEWTDPWFKL